MSGLERGCLLFADKKGTQHMFNSQLIRFLSLSVFLLTLSGGLAVEGADSKNKVAVRAASKACKTAGKKGKAHRQCVKEKLREQRK